MNIKRLIGSALGIHIHEWSMWKPCVIEKPKSSIYNVGYYKVSGQERHCIICGAREVEEIKWRES